MNVGLRAHLSPLLHNDGGERDRKARSVGAVGACAEMPVCGVRPGGHLRLLWITNESGACARELLETALILITMERVTETEDDRSYQELRRTARFLEW